jgi:predicted Zn-dependent protease
MNEHTEAIDEVIKAFNASGIVMKRSCDDYTSINMSMSEVGFEDDTLAVTNAYGFPLTFYNLDSLGQEQESYQIFVPMIFVWQRIIRFNLTEKSPTLANKRVFQLTLVHEIGHALGAPHTADTANIMYPYVSASTNQSLKSATRQVKDSTNYLQRYRTTK